ncbi:hypothetical protein [Leptospira barantonii]|uniref:PIN like domain-containing protein n=1 Tax=Leptospira barantonii TaxID=2023184 RepID=A0ABX4NN80_9LEPT|nr:hypothetical protein [Leptospira barantonii]PJZ58286.1 hypothetical protein CH367_07865 [Leptospira barantonii]
MTSFNQKEFFFLTTCYTNKVNETIVFKYFVLKYILDYVNKSEKNFKIQNNIKKKYGIYIPLTLLDKVLTSLSQEFIALEFSEDILTCKNDTFALSHELGKFTAEYDSVVGTVIKSFNEYLFNNGVDRCTFDQFTEALDSINDLILDSENNKEKRNSLPKREKLLLEFISYAYQVDPASELVKCLNKLLYTVLVYLYFTAINYRNSKIENKSYIIDTNILTYYLGINGKSRQQYVHELFEYINKFNCSLVISIETINELSNLLIKERNDEIKYFKNANAQLTYNLMHYGKATISNLLKEFKVIIDESSKLDNHGKFSEWDKLLFSLDRYKTDKRHDRSFYEESIDHDINLLYLGEVFKKVNSFYDFRYPVITADFHFQSWYKRELKSKFDSELSGVVSLDKITLLMWIEGEGFKDTRFIAHSWGYVVESIPYFKMESANSVFRLFEENIASENAGLPPEDWRSAILIIEDHFKNEKETFRASRESVIEAIKIFKDSLYKEEREKNRALEERIEKLESVIKGKEKSKEDINIELINSKIDNLKILQETKPAIEFKTEFEKAPFKFIIKYLSERFWFLQFLKYLV